MIILVLFLLVTWSFQLKYLKLMAFFVHFSFTVVSKITN